MFPQLASMAGTDVAAQKNLHKYWQKKRQFKLQKHLNSIDGQLEEGGS